MNKHFLVTFFVLIGMIVCTCGVRQQEFLDSGKLFHLGFEPDFDKKEITFDVTVRTTGYIGFGIAPKASMINADIAIGGIKDGTPFLHDYHGGSSNASPTKDERQDWKLLEAKENTTHTYMKFKRHFDTCDEDDIVIANDTLNVIWSFGATDDFQKHTHRGGRQFLLLDPPLPIEDVSQFIKWEIRVNDTVPPDRTSYLCTFHKLMRFDTKHHIVGVEAYLENQAAIKHTHHFTVTTCRLPNQNQEMLEELLDKPGGDCFGELFWVRPFCNEVLFGWAVGGKRIMLPEHVGVPVGDDDPLRNQYIMLEVHYENPDLEVGVKYNTGFDTYYTNQLRTYEGSIIMVGHEVNPSLLIPPYTKSFMITGHCSSDVTQAYFPPEGIKAIAVNLHSHVAGRKMKVRHFRNGTELPWLMNDENYDFDYQQTRELKEEVLLLQGDHFTNECVFNTEFRGNVTLGGESTTEEMCHSFILYYPRIDLRACKSYYPNVKIFGIFGVESVDEENSNLFDPTITLPESMAGMTFSQILNEQVTWNETLKEHLQKTLRYSEHVNSYIVGNHEVEPTIVSKPKPWAGWNLKSETRDDNDGVPRYTGYPNATEYKTPIRDCSSAQSLFGGVALLICTSTLITFNL